MIFAPELVRQFVIEFDIRIVNGLMSAIKFILVRSDSVNFFDDGNHYFEGIGRNIKS
jgi:hypothetical protein